MTSVAMVERDALCDSLLEFGPDAPTLCGDWTTRDLAAHLVVRDRRPDAAPGIVSPVLAGYSEHVRQAEAERPYPEIVERVRKGPPRWSPLRLDALDRLANSVEFFVHHEDIRRATAPFETRQLDAELEDAIAVPVEKAGRLLARRLTVGLVLEPDGRPSITVHKGPDRVTVSGPIGECVLFVYGRQAVADVALRGPAPAVAMVRQAELGI